MTDLRQEVLDQLGLPPSEPLDPTEDSLDNQWNNAVGDDRDRMLAVVQQEHWQALTDAAGVFKIVDTFPKKSQQLIGLLFSKSVAHLIDLYPQCSEYRMLVFDYLHGRCTEDQVKTAWSAVDGIYKEIRGIIERDTRLLTTRELLTTRDNITLLVGQLAAIGPIKPAGSLFTDPDTSPNPDRWSDVRCAASSAAGAISSDFHSSRYTEVRDAAMRKLIGPNGPLKLLVESPNCGEFAVLSSRWTVAVECARKLFT